MSTKKQVLYISYDGMTDPLGQSQVLPYLEGLSKKGFDFHLISFEKEERYQSGKLGVKERCDVANIQWHPQNYTKKPPLLSTLKDIRQLFKVAFQLHREKNFDIVHCRSYIAALVGQKMKKKFGTKFVFDMRGFWADERVEGKIWKLSNPVFKMTYNYFKRKELEYFKEADYIISLTENGKNEILSWKSLQQQTLNIEVIPCCVDTDLFDYEKINPHRKRELKRSLHIQEEDVIMGYVGSIGTWYMLDEMLDFFKVQSKVHPNLKFLFVTGEQPASIIKKAEEKGISKEQFIFTSTVHKYVPLHISLFDFSIFFIRPTFSKKASSPTKQGELMSMGIPIVCNAGVGDTDLVVDRYHSGMVLKELNEAHYKAVNLDFSSYQTSDIRKGAIEFFSLSEGVERYEKVYLSLLD
jgi:glycosyltransferase involved in cell wall biosynthesis